MGAGPMSDSPHPLPWRLGDLDRKYYGTRVLDAEGNEVCKFWLQGDEPSEREDRFDDDGPYDSHWENVESYDLAKLVVDAVNATGVKGVMPNE